MAKETNPQSESADAAAPATTAQPKPRRARGATDRRGAGAAARSSAAGPSDPLAPQPMTPDTRTFQSTASDRSSPSMASEPSEDDIRRRAYERYVERGGGHGMDFQDWLDAERELKSTK